MPYAPPVSCADLVARPWYARQCRKVHDLGPRALAELFAEILIAAPEHDREWIASRLAAYSRMKPGAIPPMVETPLMVVPEATP